MKIGEILMQWIGTEKCDRISLIIGYIGGLTGFGFAYLYWLALNYLGGYV